MFLVPFQQQEPPILFNIYLALLNSFFHNIYKECDITPIQQLILFTIYLALLGKIL